MQGHSITYPKQTVCTRPRVNELRAGDEVEVYDGMLGDYAWFTVLDAVERNGRMKVRIEGANYYFDEGLCRDVRFNYYVPPHREPEPQPTSVEYYNGWAILHFGRGYVDYQMKRTINS